MKMIPGFAIMIAGVGLMWFARDWGPALGAALLFVTGIAGVCQAD